MRLSTRIIVVAIVLVLVCVWRARRRRGFRPHTPTKGECLRPTTYDAFLTPQECGEIISRAKTLGLDRSTVVSPGLGVVDPIRTSTQVFLPEDDDVNLWLKQKVSKFLNVPMDKMEDVQVLHYGPGQQYKPHYDACNDGCNGGYDMHRLATFFIYLNDVEAGGETAFPMIGEKVAPKRGRACHWYNIDPVTKENLPCSFHGGSPVKRGEKWACNVWIQL